jgi:hypothetical protein
LPQNFNPDVLNMSCFFRTDYWSIYRLQVFFPFIVLAILLVVSSLVRLYVWKVRPNTLVRRTLADPFERALSMYIFLLTSLFVYLLSITFSPFRCFPQIDGTQTLLPNPSQDCYGKEWKANLGFIVFALFEVVSIPCLLAFVLYSNRNNLKSNTFQWRFGILTRGYTDDFFYWEIVSMIKKAATVMTVDLTNGLSPYLKTFIFMLILAFMVGVESICRPYQKQFFPSATGFL